MAYFRTNSPFCQVVVFAKFWCNLKFSLGTFTGGWGLPAELYPHISEPVDSQRVRGYSIFVSPRGIAEGKLYAEEEQNAQFPP